MKSTLRGVQPELKSIPERKTLVKSDTAVTATVPLTSDLVKRAQEGDSEAFAALFHTHKARIYSVCLRMTNNAAEAEDLTQDAFLQVFRKIGSFRGDSAFSTWLHRISVNTVLMHFRKKSLSQVSLDEPFSNEDGSKMRREFGTRDTDLTGCVDRISLARAMTELPPGYRTIFLLHEVEGYEHKEIAEMLGCSVGNSKSQLHKAKLRIRELLARSVEERTAAQAHPRTRRRAVAARSVARPAAQSKWSMPEDMVMPPVVLVPEIRPSI